MERRAKQFERKKDAEADAYLHQVRDELRRGVHVADRATMNGI